MEEPNTVCLQRRAPFAFKFLPTLRSRDLPGNGRCGRVPVCPALVKIGVEHHQQFRVSEKLTQLRHIILPGFRRALGHTLARPPFGGEPTTARGPDQHLRVTGVKWVALSCVSRAVHCAVLAADDRRWPDTAAEVLDEKGLEPRSRKPWTRRQVSAIVNRAALY